MSVRAGTAGETNLSEQQARWLFIASCIALVATAMFFGVRADVLASQREEFGLSNQAMGWITGMAFWGFAVAIIIGGAIVDFIGMKAMLVIAFVSHVAGIAVTVFSGSFWPLFVGTLLVGLGNGAVEAAVNPMIASAYPNRKTARLNLLHVWFPGGIAIGGAAAYLLTQIGLGWQAKTAIILLPTLVYGAMFLRSFIPESERVEAGLSHGSMFKEVLKPGFLVLVFCMLLTAATELGTNQWLPSILTATAAVSGILVLVWINGLMAVGRAFGGKIVDRISPIVGTLLLMGIEI